MDVWRELYDHLLWEQCAQRSTRYKSTRQVFNSLTQNVVFHTFITREWRLVWNQSRFWGENNAKLNHHYGVDANKSVSDSPVESSRAITNSRKNTITSIVHHTRPYEEVQWGTGNGNASQSKFPNVDKSGRTHHWTFYSKQETQPQMRQWSQTQMLQCSHNMGRFQHSKSFLSRRMTNKA